MLETKQSFVEREVKINFDQEWKVIKLDEHRYYKRISGMGVKGVDFIAVHPTFGLALIELKNYQKGKSTIPNDLDTKLLDKQKGTIQVINTIHKYYQRQFYFRLQTFIGWKYLYPKEWHIWLQAKYHLDRKNTFFLGVVDY